MKTVLKYICLISFFSLLLSCSGKKSISDPKEYVSWLNNPENGLVQTKYISGLKLSVKYIPPEYSAFLELKNEKSFTPVEKDSLVKYYSKCKNFLLSVAPDDRKGDSKTGNIGTDIMFRGVSNLDEYSERSFEMNFNMEDYISLFADDTEYSPVLTNMENLYGLSSGRNIHCVFAEGDGKLDKASQLDLVFSDEIFNTGINHFVFTKEKLNNIPDFNF